MPASTDKYFRLSRFGKKPTIQETLLSSGHVLEPGTLVKCNVAAPGAILPVLIEFVGDDSWDMLHIGNSPSAKESLMMYLGLASEEDLELISKFFGNEEQRQIAKMLFREKIYFIIYERLIGWFYVVNPEKQLEQLSESY